MAVNTLGLLLALHVTPADEQERAQIGKLAKEVQAVTKESVKVCFANPIKAIQENIRQPKMRASN